MSASASRTVGITSGSSVVTDSSAAAADAGRHITGTGIPAGSVIGNVTVGTGYNLYNPNVSGTVALATATNASLSATLGGVLLFQTFVGETWAAMQATSSTFPLLPQYFLCGDQQIALPLLIILPTASTLYLGGIGVTSSSTGIGAAVTSIPTIAENVIGEDSLFAVIASSTAIVSLLAQRQ